jgi:hypothetical protein
MSLRDRVIRAARMERLSRRAKRWRRVRYWRQARLRARAALTLQRRRARRANGFRPYMLNGRPGNISRACQLFIYRAVRSGLVVTSTTGGRHAPGSYHYPRAGKGQAVDVAGPYARMVAFQRAEATRSNRFNELYGPDNRANIKNGTYVTLAEGSFLEQQHDNHVHAAPRF